MHKIIATATMMLIVLVMISCTWPQPAGQEAPKQKQKEKANTSDDIKIVQAGVNSRLDQLQRLYVKESAIQNQSGAVEFTLYVTERGIVQQVDHKVKSGNLKLVLIENMSTKIKEWTFSNKSKVIYAFTVRFSKD